MKAKNKDFSPVLQTDLTTSVVPSVAQVIRACNVVVYNAKIKQNAPFFSTASAATQINIRNARKHFERLEKVSSNGHSLKGR